MVNVASRIYHTHDTEYNWSDLKTFIPSNGEIIVYDPDEYYSYPRFKIGDGVTALYKLPFIADNEWEEL